MVHRKRDKDDHHKRLTQKHKKLFPSPTDHLLDTEAKVSVSKEHLRKPYKFHKYKPLIQILSAVVIFSVFYIYAARAYPSNGFVYLITFGLLYVLCSTLIAGFLLKYLSGDKYSLNMIFTEFFYIIGLIVGVFGLTYLPILLALFINERTSEWLQYAFITALIVFPISYVLSIFLRYLKSESLTIRQFFKRFFDREGRRIRKEQYSEASKEIDEFYEGFDQLGKNYQKKISRTLTKEDFKQK
ncbi:MAG: hypothetical protein GPJ51_03440 [Candidatus Heimdallarchaeota archaeon]|nr:hypothetical protein [Candidatus Heimdallarchaeota archaeon]